MHPISLSRARMIFSTLVANFEVSKEGLDDFVLAVCGEDAVTEYPLKGGIPGSTFFNTERGWRVGCKGDEVGPVVLDKIETANALLYNLFKQATKPDSDTE